MLLQDTQTACWDHQTKCLSNGMQTRYHNSVPATTHWKLLHRILGNFRRNKCFVYFMVTGHVSVLSTDCGTHKVRTVSISSLERNQGKGNNPQDRFSPVETPTIEDAAAPPNKFAADWANWSKKNRRFGREPIARRKILRRKRKRGRHRRPISVGG